LSGCADGGTATDIAALKNLVTSVAWTSVVTVNGKKCIQFNLGTLQGIHNATSTENCSLTAIAVKAGSDASTDLVCEPQNPPTTSTFTSCRTHIESNGQTKDVSSVTICLCCKVSQVG